MNAADAPPLEALVDVLKAAAEPLPALDEGRTAERNRKVS